MSKRRNREKKEERERESRENVLHISCLTCSVLDAIRTQFNNFASKQTIATHAGLVPADNSWCQSTIDSFVTFAGSHSDEAVTD